MSDIQILKRKINELEALADEIERSSKELIEKAPLLYKPDPPGVASAFPHHHGGTLSEDIKELQREVVRKYQRWYSSAYKLIKEMLIFWVISPIVSLAVSFSAIFILYKFFI